MSIKARKVLILDDSDLCREIVKYVLETRGYEVFAIDSSFALSHAHVTVKPDLVLVDVNMPALRGDQAVRIALRNISASCRIVFHSGQPEEELRALVRATGAHGYIVKSSNHEALADAVDSYLSLELFLERNSSSFYPKSPRSDRGRPCAGSARRSG